MKKRSHFSSINELQAWLFQIPMFSRDGVKAVHYSLENIQAALRALGSPQHHFFSIHVAGTNGKGSTVRILESVYLQAGYKVGAFTSPHLIRYNERVRVNGQEVSDEYMLDFFNEYKALLESYKLSYFEISTLLAFKFFSAQKVDLAVVECGLGGRLDATNVLENKICAITSIDYDHMDVLGHTLGQIATEKAGIMRSNQLCVLGNIGSEKAYKAIAEHAKSIGAEVMMSKNSDLVVSACQQIGVWELSYLQKKQLVSSSLMPTIQLFNIQTALALIDKLQQQFPIGFEQICIGLEYCRIPARFERLVEGREWYFDGCHNLASVKQMVKTATFIRENPIFVLSFMQDKVTADLRHYLQSLDNLYLYQLDSPRAWHISNEIDTLNSAVRLQHADFRSFFTGYENDLVILGGSFYFYSTVKKWFS